ncbi:hypothetical protein EG68_12006 [Paragonimus skrjabini miyazakii]|uniref:Uncharacterized protein n=1 Tax=Paragonimus skrjabini miyazakii TaxID=59628 RepID=A0A8S9YFV7_9TREM|nr:hypothetical protein EG68_12006 [Paragonimus skrjabini miyazakii]
MNSYPCEHRNITMFYQHWYIYILLRTTQVQRRDVSNNTGMYKSVHADWRWPALPALFRHTKQSS